MKKFLIFTVSLLMFSSMQAKQIGTSTALEKAKMFSASVVNNSKGTEKVMELVYTESTGDTDNLYIFNIGNNGGFVIVSADDCTESVLGYCDEGSFDPNNIPPNMKYMLEEYKNEINYAIEHNLTATAVAGEDTRTAVKPLLKTKWNQREPYNNLCPEYEEGKRSVTGCAATAMAQVMKHFNWPEQGTETTTYTINNDYFTGKTLTVDFSQTKYDWAHMANTYTKSSTAEENAAVATLMYHCGVSIYMNYGPTSGAGMINVFYALVNNFSYDKSTKYTHRRYYSIQEWNNLIYEEIKNNRPVYYAGRNTEAGHAFVCDGYDKDNYFHINWGWGGMSDGYFKLSALNPSAQGAGGSSSGYNTNQEIIYNIDKDKGSTTYETEIGIDSGFAVDNTTVTSDIENVTLSWNRTFTVYNSSPYKFTVRLGVMAVNEDTQKKTFITGNNAVYSLIGASYLLNSCVIGTQYLNSLAEGNYKIYLAFIDENNDTSDYVKVPYGAAQYLEMNKTGNTLTFTTPTENTPKLSLVDLIPNSEMYVGRLFESTIILKSEGADYIGNIRPVILDFDRNEKYIGDEFPVEIEDGKETTTEVTFTVPELTPDRYLYCVIDENRRVLGWYQVINIEESPAKTTAYATSISFPDNNNVDPNNMELTAEIECTEGYMDYYVYAFLDSELGESAYFGPKQVCIEAQQSKTITFNGSVDWPEGTKASLYLFSYDFVPGMLSDYMEFTIGKPSGIESAKQDASVSIYPNPTADRVTVTAPEAIRAVEVYSISGNLLAKQAVNGTATTIDVSHLASGVYMAKIITEQGTYTKHIAKK